MAKKSKSKAKESRQEKIARLIEKIQPLPAVLALPHHPTKAQKQWWNKYIGTPFKDSIAKKGSKTDNGMTWVHDQFVGEFCNEKYPHLTQKEREQYHGLIGKKIYDYLTNHSSSGGSGVTVPEAAPKVRAYGYNVWRREKPDQFEQMKTEFLASNPKHNENNVGTRRSLYSALFALLPKDERKDYSARASEELKASQALDLLLGGERDAYNENIPRRLKAFMREVETSANARIYAQLLTEDGKGNLTIASVASDSLRDFQTTEESCRALHAMRQWCQSSATQGKRIDGGAPLIAVYPDKSQDGFPRLPNFVGATLSEAQKLMRVYITMVWVYMGGVGKVPWEEISQDVEKWIEPARIPADAIWKDPSSLPLAAVLVWLEHFTACQNGAIPAGKRFQFRLVIAGSRPIAPSISQETSRELVRRNDKDTWVFNFVDTITKCHHLGDMPYPESSLAYAEFLATGKFSSPSHAPDGLPAGGQAPTSLIDGDAQATILEHADQLPEDVRDLVKSLLETVNTHQSHYPASQIPGLWAGKSTLPALLPDTPPADFDAALREFILDFQLPRCYFQAPAEPGDASTIAWFEPWQRKLLAEGVLHHESSGTLLGGYSGVVWVVAALIKLVFNFAALRGDIPHPVELPADYDVSRIPLAEWKRLLDWCRSWLSRLEGDIEVLRQTSEERRNASPNQPPVPSTSASTPPPDAPASAPSKPSQSRKARPKMKKASARPSRAGLDSEEEDGGNVPSDSDSEEEDYDKLDASADSDGLSSEAEHDDTELDDFGMGGNDDAWGAGPSAALPPNQPIPAPPSSSGPTPSAPHVFGPLRSLPVLKKPLPVPKEYNDIISGLEQFDLDIHDALREWYRLTSCWKDIRLDKDEDAGAATPANLPSEYQPLFDFVLKASMSWRRAAKVAPRVFDIVLDFSMLIRRSIPFTAAAN